MYCVLVLRDRLILFSCMAWLSNRFDRHVLLSCVGILSCRRVLICASAPCVRLRVACVPVFVLGLYNVVSYCKVVYCVIALCRVDALSCLGSVALSRRVLYCCGFVPCL